MEYNNSKKTIFLPLIIGLSIIIGILIGNKFLPAGNNISNLGFSSKPDKLGSIVRLIQENYVDKLSTDSIEELAIPEILKLLDPHSVYIPAKDLQEVNEPLDGNFDGIGVQFNVQNDTIMIINTISGGPSDKLGILAGDRIITINDSMFAGKKITSDDVIKHLKGKRGTFVKVGIQRKGLKKLLHFEIKRDIIPLYSVDVAYMLSDNTGYIKISKFAKTTADEFKTAAQTLINSGMKKLVLDLRQNGGGYLDAAASIADEFLANGKQIVYTKGYSRQQTNYTATNEGICENIKLAVLIDSWSASASEIVAGAIQDNDRGIIVGRRSFGKGLVQEPVMFPDGSAVRLTIARYYTPTGRCIQKSYKNGNDDYMEEMKKRNKSGEFMHPDSIHFPDSLKFKTPNGKIVYGGGGIMPDFYIPIDTSIFTKYYEEIVSKGLLYKYAIKYTDDNRNILKTFKTVETLNKYLLSQNVYSKFNSFLAVSGVKGTNLDVKNSEKELSTVLRAYICRNILDDKGFYPILRETDKELQKAEEELNKEK